VSWLRYVLLGGVGFPLLGFRLDTRPVLTCPPYRMLILKDSEGENRLVKVATRECTFSVEIEDASNRICFREIGKTDFLKCEKGEAGLNILPVTVQAPRTGGAIVFEALTINTRSDPPLRSSPASTLGFLPNPQQSYWRNNLTLLIKRIRLRSW